MTPKASASLAEAEIFNDCRISVLEVRRKGLQVFSSNNVVGTCYITVNDNNIRAWRSSPIAIRTQNKNRYFHALWKGWIYGSVTSHLVKATATKGMLSCSHCPICVGRAFQQDAKSVHRSLNLTLQNFSQKTILLKDKSVYLPLASLCCEDAWHGLHRTEVPHSQVQ